jgi:haloalkane dehalogenase
MNVLRTPDERFTDLPGYPFAPHYVDIDDLDGAALRVHYLDEGPADAAPVLMLHGEPSWSYLYRTMIPVLVAAGHRVVAPDLVGFGRSDKPAEQDDYTFERHVRWMAQVVFDHLDLRDITYFGQDWGALVGLRLFGEQPGRYSRIVIGNGGLPTGDQKLSDAFLSWQKFSRETEHFPVGGIVNGGCTTDLAPAVVAAYDAPFPDESYKAGARIFPSLVPTSPEDPAAAANREAWTALRGFDRPFLCAFSDKDPITKGGERVFLREVPGTNGQPHTTVEGAGHFLQEDAGPRLAEVINAFIAGTPA